MSVNKISNSAAAAIQAYKDKSALDENSKVQGKQNDKVNQKQAAVEKSSTEENSTKVTLTSQKLAKELMEKTTTSATQTEKVEAAHRQARIEEIAKQVKNNTYKVNSEVVADKMLKDQLIVKHMLGM